MKFADAAVELLAIVLLAQNQEVLCEPSVIETSRPVPLKENITACSTRLANTLYDFCYTNIKVIRRDVHISPLLDALMPTPAPVKNRRRIKLSRRVRRQISEECCERSCSIEHLLMYCHPNTPVNRGQP